MFNEDVAVLLVGDLCQLYITYDVAWNTWATAIAECGLDIDVSPNKRCTVIAVPQTNQSKTTMGNGNSA